MFQIVSADVGPGAHVPQSPQPFEHQVFLFCRVARRLPGLAEVCRFDEEPEPLLLQESGNIRFLTTEKLEEIVRAEAEAEAAETGEDDSDDALDANWEEADDNGEEADENGDDNG